MFICGSLYFSTDRKLCKTDIDRLNRWLIQYGLGGATTRDTREPKNNLIVRGGSREHPTVYSPQFPFRALHS